MPTWNSTHSRFTSSLKQSYLTAQILAIFVFFICFMLAALIRLQFKYHRLALNLYDYDMEQGGAGAGAGGGGGIWSGGAGILNGHSHHRHASAATAVSMHMNDRDGNDSLASTTTGSHFSSSMSKRLTTLLKRLLHRLLTKIASVLLYVTLGYQFCQNCFVESSASVRASHDSYGVFVHVAIALSVLFRSVVVVLEKRNSMNKLDYVKRLQRKQLLLGEAAAATAKTARPGDSLFYAGLRGQQQSTVDEIELAPSRDTFVNPNRKLYE